MRKIYTLSGLFILLAIAGYSQTRDLSGYKVGANGFVENKGQIIDQNHNANRSVKFLLCRPGFNIQLRQTGFSYDTYTDSVTRDSSSITYSKNLFRKNKNQPEKFIRHYHRVDIELVGCNRNTPITVEEKSTTYFNYFTADITQGGVSDIHYYQRVIYKNIYPHIDLEFYTLQKNPALNSSVPVEYQFIIHPGGKPTDIKLAYKGVDKIKLRDDRLIISAAKGDFTENIPESYLMKHKGKEPVKVSYTKVDDNVFGFSLPEGTAITSDLIIDPVPNLVWGTYYGGINTDYIFSSGIALGNNDSVYITGATNNTSNIATAGAYQTIYAGNYDAFVAKFNPSGTSLIWGTYYGGGGYDWASAIAVDANNDAYITGGTSSPSGIATAGTYQIKYGGGNDAFVAKFNSAGTSLLWGTYYGGAEWDSAWGIVLDASDDVYIIGETLSTSGIATAGAYETTAPNGACFVAKFNPSGSSLLWGTYYESGVISGIALDAVNNVYMTGYTLSGTGIATPGAYQTTLVGLQTNAFAAKLNSTANSILWGTYYGVLGNANHNAGTLAHAIVIDAGDNVYITGETTSDSGIATPGAYQTKYPSQATRDGFVAKFNSTGTSLLWGTYYGGIADCWPFGIALDAKDNVYIAGIAGSSNGITTPGAYQTVCGTLVDAFVAKFNPSGTCLLWGSFYGGTGKNSTEAYGLALDANNNVFITGMTNSPSKIATPGAYQTIYGVDTVFNWGGFVAKFDSTDVSTYTILATPNDTTICEGTSISITASGGINYNWDPASGLSCTGCPNPIVTPIATTTYTVTDSALGCRVSSATVTVKVCAKPDPNISGQDSLCKGYQDNLIATGGTYYKWSNGETGAQYRTGSVNADSTILVIVIDSLGKTGCSDTALFKIKPIIAPTVTVVPPPIACEGSPVTIQANVTGPGSFSYSWSPGNGTTSTITVKDSNITYTVNVSNGCDVVDSARLNADIPALSACCNNVIILGSDTIITASGKGIKSYRWEPVEGLTCDTCPTITVTPMVTTTYTVIGTDSMGCEVERLITIIVEQPCSKFIVPNVFTPGYAGPSGVNDVFYIQTNNIDAWSLLIYDRWGKEVYKSTNPYQFWKGLSESGSEAPDGVYYYIINVACQGASYKRDGFVQLIR